MSAASPVMMWTPAEAWLMGELARRAIRASLDGQPAIRADTSETCPFRAVVRSEDDAQRLDLEFDADSVTLTLADIPIEGHCWRTGWLLEIVGPDAELLGVLEPGGAVDLADARRGGSALFRVKRRAVVRALDGIDEIVPMVDLAFHRYTRQSTAVPAGDPSLPPWALPTELEVAPWWEIDLGRAVYVGWFRIDLAPIPPDVRIVCRAYGFVMQDGSPPPHSTLAVEYGVDGDRAWLTFEARHVARHIRIDLITAGHLASLAITGAEIIAGDLHADTLIATMRRAFVLHRDRTLCVVRDGDAYRHHLTYAEVWTQAMALAAGLACKLEIGESSRPVVGVMLTNRVEWILVELALLVRGYLVVAMAPDDGDDRISVILARARITCVICEGTSADRIAQLAPALLIVALDDDRVGPRRIPFAALVANVETPPAVVARSQDDAYSVLFTSGSTGTPKGAVRTYAGFFAVIASYEIAHAARHLSFQPLSHLSERMYLPTLLFFGSTLAFSQGGAHLLDELRAFEPTTVGSVPRLYEVLHAGYTRRLRAAIAAEPDVPRALLETRCLADARAIFGSRLLAVSVGSAPVSAEVFAFMKRCFADVWVSEGYGSTEVGSITFDGRILAHVAVKLVPSDATPRQADLPERGEIWVNTPHAIAGYLGDDGSATPILDEEGYFATGDLGERDSDGLVRVIGRLRNSVKLAQGEFVSAERIETALAGAAIVDRIYVHVESGAPGVAALIVPVADVLARALGVPTDTPLATLVPGAAATVLAALRTQARAAGLGSFEIPRDVLLEATPPTVESGLLTTSNKLARGAFALRYGPQLSALAAGDAVFAQPLVTDEDLLARVVRAARTVTGRAVDPREPIGTGIGVDSLAAAEILATLSDDLGRDVPLAWWFEARTLEDLAVRLGSFAGGATATAAELPTADRALAGAFTPTTIKLSLTRVLLTGATGFLGAHLVEEFLARGIAVTCLVRAADDAAATVRLRDALTRYAIPLDARDDRIHAIAGDLGVPGLGLGEHRDLAAVDAIVHAGATVSWLASYHALRGPNVLGTHALLELAAAHGLPVHHISTISTVPVGGDETSRLTFAGALAGTPYGLSKWIAEDLALRARAAGLPVAIYRPAMVANHTSRGTGNPDDFINRYLVGCSELGRYIDRDDAILDMTPVDFVARALAALVIAAPHTTATYHLANVDQSLSFAALGRAMVAAGLALTPTTYDEFRSALHAHRTSRLHALAAFFPERFSLGMGPWPCTQTLATLAPLGIARPPIDDKIIATYVAAMGTLSTSTTSTVGRPSPTSRDSTSSLGTLSTSTTSRDPEIR